MERFFIEIYSFFYLNNMAKTKKEKKVLKESYSTKIKDSKGFIVLKPTKLTPNETNEFRKEIFDFGASFNIVKNSIFKLSLKDNNLPEISELSQGEHAIMFVSDKIAEAAKALKKFIDATKTKDKTDRVEIISGLIDGIILDKAQVKELSEMPSKEGSISLILGVLDMAIGGIVNVLEDAPRGIVSVLDQAFKE